MDLAQVKHADVGLPLACFGLLFFAFALPAPSGVGGVRPGGEEIAKSPLSSPATSLCTLAGKVQTTGKVEQLPGRWRGRKNRTNYFLSISFTMNVRKNVHTVHWMNHARFRSMDHVLMHHMILLHVDKMHKIFERTKCTFIVLIFLNVM